MNIPDCMECPSCSTSVKPLRRKVPRASENVSPQIEFGWFCPVENCSIRLDRAIAALDSEPLEEPSIDPNDLPEDILPRSDDPNVVSPKPTIVKVVPIRHEKEPEDLLALIPREHEKVIREERELRSRLSIVVERREKLDRLMAAMNDISSPIAAK